MGFNSARSPQRQPRTWVLAGSGLEEGGCSIGPVSPKAGRSGKGDEPVPHAESTQAG